MCAVCAFLWRGNALLFVISACNTDVFCFLDSVLFDGL